MWLINSSIGKKLIMSISGLFLVLFLTFHLVMNFVAVFSPEGYNMICGFLGANWYAIAGTLVLVAGFVAHIIYALLLTLQNLKARGNDRYLVTARPKGVEWASQNMLVLGVVVVLGLVLHGVQFWYKMQLNELAGLELHGIDPADGYALIKETFSQPLFVIIYLVWFGAIWLHLTHGFWSAIHTIGWNNQIWMNRWKAISNIFTTIICIGFAFVALWFYFVVA